MSQDHSEVPTNEEDWPSKGSILSFRQRTKERLLKVYEDIASEKLQLTRSVARVLFMTYEHEAMHLEVSLFFRSQSTTLDPAFWD